MSDNEDGPEPPLPPLLADDENPEGATMYKYRDFGSVPEDQDVGDGPSDSPPPPPPSARGGSLESSIRVQKFPVKLYAILGQKEFLDIITWMPHGRSWKVLKPNLFESLVMPLFFEYSNYHSFNRLVNAWSFRRISSGPDRGSYYHELFLRGKPHLQKYMRRLPKTHKKLPMKKEDEPDFYKLDKTNPLPSLEESPVPSTTLVPQIRPQPGLGGTMVPPSMHSMSSAAGLPPGFHGLSGPKDSYEARDGLMGMGSSLQSNGFVSSSMGMNAAMSGMPGMNNMNAMNGINNLREAQFAQQGMGDFCAPFGAHQSASQLDQYQRLRQLQQMQLLERQMGSATGQMQLSGDPFAMMLPDNALALRVNRQQC